MARVERRREVGALAAICVSISGTAAIAAPKEPVLLEPSSQWQVDYADDSCRLARQFGQGDQKSFLILDQYEPGAGYGMVLSGKLFGGTVNGDKADIRFGPNEEEAKIFFSAGNLGDNPAMIFSSVRLGKSPEGEEVEGKERWVARPSSDMIGEAREDAVRYLEVDAYGFDPIRLQTGSLAAPMKAVRACVDELMSHWGIDVARNKTASRLPVPERNPGKWLTSSDYPSDLVRKGAQGLVHFRLNVDETGAVTDCNIQSSTRPEGFDRAVCQAISKRAHFEPALDADGKPLASYWINRVRFEIPG